MKNQPLNLSPAIQAVTLSGHGNGFWYESATVAGDARIVVQSARGDEIVLRPGQSFRITEEVTTWYVRLFDNAATIAANIIIGSGEYDDHNTTIATGSFSVTNFPATQPVSGTVALSGTSATKNRSTYTTTAATTATSATLVTAAANVNGVIIECAQISATTQTGDALCTGAIIAKTGAAPANITDGDVILTYAVNGQTSTAPQSISVTLPTSIFVPAGKAIYAKEFNGTPLFQCKSIICTIL